MYMSTQDGTEGHSSPLILVETTSVKGLAALDLPRLFMDSFSDLGAAPTTTETTERVGDRDFLKEGDAGTAKAPGRVGLGVLAVGKMTCLVAGLGLGFALRRFDEVEAVSSTSISSLSDTGSGLNALSSLEVFTRFLRGFEGWAFCFPLPFELMTLWVSSMGWSASTSSWSSSAGRGRFRVDFLRPRGDEGGDDLSDGGGRSWQRRRSQDASLSS